MKLTCKCGAMLELNDELATSAARKEFYTTHTVCLENNQLAIARKALTRLAFASKYNTGCGSCEQHHCIAASALEEMEREALE